MRTKRNSVQKSICIVAPVHAWDDVRVFQKEAYTLAQAGYNVTLIAKTRYRRQVKGITVIPCIGHGVGRFVRLTLLPLVALQSLRENADIYHLHNPDTLPVAVLLKFLGKKVIYDTHEDFAKRILVRKWVPKILRFPLATIVDIAERLVARVVDATIATQENVVKRIANNALLLGNPPLLNSIQYESVKEYSREIIDDGEHLRAIYIGSINAIRGLNEMVDALAIANRTASVRLWLIGAADKDDFENASKRLGWEYVDYMPRMEQERAFAYVMRSDVGLIVIHDVCDYAYTDPNKIYEYMMFEIPFIASSFEAWRHKLNGADAGWFVNPDSVEEIASILCAISNDVKMAHKKGVNGKEFIKTYNWDLEAKKLLALYRNIES